MAKDIKKKTRKRKADKQEVQRLKQWRKKRNRSLKGTNYRCTLHPKKCEPCTSCFYREACFRYVNARFYLLLQEKRIRDAQMRKARKRRKEYNHYDVILGEEYNDAFPCEPFDISCPDREKCQNGRFCSWKI